MAQSVVHNLDITSHIMKGSAMRLAACVVFACAVGILTGVIGVVAWSCWAVADAMNTD